MTFREFMAENNYELLTTFWDDFSIADRFGVSAVRDTFNRAFAEWKEDYQYLTELILVLNHKIWQHYEKRPELVALYQSFWEQADRYAVEHLQGDDELLLQSDGLSGAAPMGGERRDTSRAGATRLSSLPFPFFRGIPALF